MHRTAAYNSEQLWLVLGMTRFAFRRKFSQQHCGIIAVPCCNYELANGPMASSPETSPPAMRLPKEIVCEILDSSYLQLSPDYIDKHCTRVSVPSKNSHVADIEVLCHMPTAIWSINRSWYETDKERIAFFVEA